MIFLGTRFAPLSQTVSFSLGIKCFVLKFYFLFILALVLERREKVIKKQQEKK